MDDMGSAQGRVRHSLLVPRTITPVYVILFKPTYIYTSIGRCVTNMSRIPSDVGSTVLIMHAEPA